MRIYFGEMFLYKIKYNSFDSSVESIRDSLEKYSTIDRVRVNSLLEKKSKRNSFHNWDGFLNKSDSRDNRINKIVK